MVFCPKEEEILWTPLLLLLLPPPQKPNSLIAIPARDGPKKRGPVGFFFQAEFYGKVGCVCVCLSVGVFPPLSVAHKIEQSLICVNVRFSANFKGNKFFLFRFFPALPAQFTVFRLAFIPELVFGFGCGGGESLVGESQAFPIKNSKRIKSGGDPYLYPFSSSLKGGAALSSQYINSPPRMNHENIKCFDDPSISGRYATSQFTQQKMAKNEKKDSFCLIFSQTRLASSFPCCCKKLWFWGWGADKLKYWHFSFFFPTQTHASYPHGNGP